MLSTISCKNGDDDIVADCGCESDTQTIIPESANVIGRISFKRQIEIDTNDDYYNNTYWITYLVPGCSNCVSHMIVCNEDYLKTEFKDLLDLPQGEYVEVKFSGELKEVCQKRFDLADIVYKRILLTSIQRQ
ncbi:hypothetical protein [Yeosuana sp.]|uniref:hypothetical protein n=1 Tax=Yeosuana sp. TaxID=2529388 RepID=UPI0040550DE1